MVMKTNTAPKSKAQKFALARILAAGPEGVIETANWVAAKSLVRAGLVKTEVIRSNVPARDALRMLGIAEEQWSRFDLYTVRGTPRTYSIERYVAV